MKTSTDTLAAADTLNTKVTLTFHNSELQQYFHVFVWNLSDV